LYDVGREVRELAALRVVGSLGRGDEQSKDQRRHRGDEAHHQPHDVLRAFPHVIIRQPGAQDHAGEGAEEDDAENDPRDGKWAHAHASRRKIPQTMSSLSVSMSPFRRATSDVAVADG
jgi:hypothetical protein